ncbi:hypothetical protein Tco_0408128 [Tanacetum coccineum]
MSVEDLVVRLRIEEDNKLAQKDTYTPDSAKANMVEHAGSSSRFNSKGNKKDKKKNDKKGKGKCSPLLLMQEPKRGVNQSQAIMVDEELLVMIALVSDVCAMILRRRVDNGRIRSCRWELLQLMISRVKEMLFCSDIRERAQVANVLIKCMLEWGYAVDAFLNSCNGGLDDFNKMYFLLTDEFFNVWLGRLGHGTGSSSRLDDKVLRDKRQRDDNDLHDERQDQTDEEEVPDMISTYAVVDKNPAVIVDTVMQNWLSDIMDSRMTSGYVFT